MRGKLRDKRSELKRDYLKRESLERRRTNKRDNRSLNVQLHQQFEEPTRCATRSTLVKQATSGTKTVRTSVYFCVGMLVFQTRPVKGAESYVAEIRDLIILAMFVLPQAEGPGRAVAGRTSRCLHLQHLCRLLSTGHAERAREAASSPSLLNVA